MIDIKEYGERAILINFKQEISTTVHNLVKHYAHLISTIPSVLYQVPAYCSITVVFDQSKTTFHQLKSEINNLRITRDKNSTVKRTIEIPVCYERAYSLDMDELTKELNMKAEEIISTHTSTPYDVYMMGFLPGFPYLGKLFKSLVCKRKKWPRKRVPSGSVGIAGQQTGIYPSEAPGGWKLIGQTPIRLFNPEDDNCFAIQMGDRIQFYSISAKEFEEIQHYGK